MPLPNAASTTARLPTASARVEPLCTIAPAPFTPVRSTPPHCDTIHWALDTVIPNVIVSGPLPGAPLIARKMVSRLRGAPTGSSVVLVTSVQVVIPPPDSVGLAGAAVEPCPSTATVMSVLAAGAMDAVL